MSARAWKRRRNKPVRDETIRIVPGTMLFRWRYVHRTTAPPIDLQALMNAAWIESVRAAREDAT